MRKQAPPGAVGYRLVLPLRFGTTMPQIAPAADASGALRFYRIEPFQLPDDIRLQDGQMYRLLWVDGHGEPIPPLGTGHLPALYFFLGPPDSEVQTRQHEHAQAMPNLPDPQQPKRYQAKVAPLHLAWLKHRQQRWQKKQDLALRKAEQEAAMVSCARPMECAQMQPEQTAHSLELRKAQQVPQQGIQAVDKDSVHQHDTAVAHAKAEASPVVLSKPALAQVQQPVPPPLHVPPAAPTRSSTKAPVPIGRLVLPFQQEATPSHPATAAGASKLAGAQPAQVSQAAAEMSLLLGNARSSTIGLLAAAPSPKDRQGHYSLSVELSSEEQALMQWILADSRRCVAVVYEEFCKRSYSATATPPVIEEIRHLPPEDRQQARVIASNPRLVHWAALVYASLDRMPVPHQSGDLAGTPTPPPAAQPTAPTRPAPQAVASPRGAPQRPEPQRTDEQTATLCQIVLQPDRHAVLMWMYRAARIRAQGSEPPKLSVLHLTQAELSAIAQVAASPVLRERLVRIQKQLSVALHRGASSLFNLPAPLPSLRPEDAARIEQVRSISGRAPYLDYLLRYQKALILGKPVPKMPEHRLSPEDRAKLDWVMQDLRYGVYLDHLEEG